MREGERRKEIAYDILRFLREQREKELPVSLQEIEVLAGDESGFYLSVLRELADRGTVTVEGESVRYEGSR